MLFYLLIKKDGSTTLPAPNAIHPDFAPSAAQLRVDSTVGHARAPSLPLPLLSGPSSAVPAVDSKTQNASHPDVATSQLSAPPALDAESDLLSRQAPAATGQPEIIVQQALQQTAGKEQRQVLAENELDVTAEGSSSGVHRSAAAPAHLTVPPQLSLPALAAPPPPSPLLPLSHSVPPPSAPASPQLQPALPQLRPSSPLHQPLHQPQLSKQQMLQQLQGMHSHQAAHPQDISKEFLALLQETSTHLTGSHQPWSGQRQSTPASAGTSGKPERRQPINNLDEAVGVKQKIDCDAHHPSDLGKAAASAEEAAAESSVCKQHGQSQVEVSGTMSTSFGSLVPWYCTLLVMCVQCSLPESPSYTCLTYDLLRYVAS